MSTSEINRERPFSPSPIQLTDAPSSESFDHWQEVDNDEEDSAYLSPEHWQIVSHLSCDTNPAISTKMSTPSTFTSSIDPGYEIVDPAAPSESFHVISHSEVMALVMMAPVKKPLKCPHCTFSSVLKHNLETHIGTHNNEESKRIAALSAHVISDSEAPTATVKKLFKCPHSGCTFSSARKKGLKTHVKTHNKEASKRFGCSTCSRQFTRKRDLNRHCETIHGDQKPSSSLAFSAPSHRFNSRPDLPLCRTTTASGDERPTISPHPRLLSGTGLEDLMARWENAGWLQPVSEVP